MRRVWWASTNQEPDVTHDVVGKGGGGGRTAGARPENSNEPRGHDLNRRASLGTVSSLAGTGTRDEREGKGARERQRGTIIVFLFFSFLPVHKKVTFFTGDKIYYWSEVKYDLFTYVAQL